MALQNQSRLLINLGKRFEVVLRGEPRCNRGAVRQLWKLYFHFASLRQSEHKDNKDQYQVAGNDQKG
jgi:hypothetical protein